MRSISSLTDVSYIAASSIQQAQKIEKKHNKTKRKTQQKSRKCIYFLNLFTLTFFKLAMCRERIFFVRNSWEMNKKDNRILWYINFISSLYFYTHACICIPIRIVKINLALISMDMIIQCLGGFGWWGWWTRDTSNFIIDNRRRRCER